MGNEIGTIMVHSTPKHDKVFKKKTQSSCLGGSKPRFRKKQNK